MGTMLVIRDRRHPDRLRLRDNRRWLRAATHLLAGPLDRRLAAGQAPESGLLLAGRAEALVAKRHRQALADLLAAHLRSVGRPAGRPRSSLPPARGEITGAAAAIGEVVARIARPGPVPARGVAMVSLLLTSGAGPLFTTGGEETLTAALGRATEHLDPAGALVPAA